MDKYETRQKTKKIIRKIIVMLKFTILIIILVGIPAYIYFFQNQWIDNFRSMEAIDLFLLQHKTSSIFVYIGMQIIQIIICIIPGQALQFAAGYAFGFWLGYLYSIIGCTIGTFITFYLARILGKGALSLIFGEEKFSKFIDKLNSKRAFILVFIIYLIPGLPKDLFTYAAGVSDIKIKPFLLLTIVGRTGAMMCSIMIGSMFNNGSYIGVAILGIIMVILCILGVWKHKNLAKQVDRWYVKLKKL